MRTYHAVYPCVTVTAAQTLMYLTAPSTMCGRITYANIAVADVDTNEQTYACIDRISSLGTPTGTPVTPAKLSNGDPASSFTCKADITASEPTYAGTPVAQEAFPMISGWRFQPRDESEYMEIKPSESVGVRLLGAISSSTVTVRIDFQEIG